MLSWYELMTKNNPLNYGRDTGTWNRAKILGATDMLIAIANVFGDGFATHIAINMPAQTLLDQMNTDRTADNITIREE